MRDVIMTSVTSSRSTPAAGGRPACDVADHQATLAAHDALVEIARAITGRSSATEVAQVVVDEVRRLVPSDRGSVSHWLPERDAIQILAVGAGFDVLGLAIGDVVPVDDGAFRVVLEQGRSLREADLGRHHTRLERLLAADGQHARLIVPVLV